MRISLLRISLLRFFKTITKIWLMQFYRLFILQYRIHNRKKLFGNYTTFIWKINEGQKNYNCYCATGISVISYPLRSLTKANQKDIKKRSVSTLKGDTHNVSTTPLWQGGFRQYLPFSWTTLRGKHCQHPIAVMGAVYMFGSKVLGDLISNSSFTFFNLYISGNLCTVKSRAVERSTI